MPLFVPRDMNATAHQIVRLTILFAQMVSADVEKDIISLVADIAVQMELKLVTTIQAVIIKN